MAVNPKHGDSGYVSLKLNLFIQKESDVQQLSTMYSLVLFLQSAGKWVITHITSLSSFDGLETGCRSRQSYEVIKYETD